MSDLLEIIEDARLVASGSLPSEDACVAFARALAQVADACVIGLPCEKHGGAVHGREAEELRKGIELLLVEHGTIDSVDAYEYAELRRDLIRLLDRIDARDSLAFLEATDGKGADTAPAEDSDEDNAYRLRCEARRAFFAERSLGDKIAWGFGRSGTLQKIEDDFVTVLDDGWPSDLPLIVFTPPFVVKLKIDLMGKLLFLGRAKTP